jgi:cell filamentation protein
MDPYVYPGTSLLRNLRNFRDAAVLSEFEAEATARRLRQLEHKSLSGAFDSGYLQAIHHHIFQDVYDWAGDFRTVSISKSGDPFAFPQHIASSLNKTCEELKREGHLNAIHPFREGNGRTQREFIRELALQSGLMIDWRQVKQEEMIEASRRSLRIDNAALEQVLRKALDPA